MKILKPSVKFIKGSDETTMLKNIEKIARTCYKSEHRISEDDSSAKIMIGNLIKNEHFAMIEHESVTYKVICDRGVSHEIVRHRMASYAQESTRYVNYSNDRYGSEISVIDIGTGFNYTTSSDTDFKKYEVWLKAMENAEKAYMDLINLGASPQEARSVLPNSTKTEIVMTMNLREWIHFFGLRCDKAAHPQMREVANMILDDMVERYPTIFHKKDN